MRASLVIEAEEGEPRVFPLPPDRTVTVGRHRNNLIVLHDEHASRWHAEVFQEEGRWFIRDFGALNGTRVNGEPIMRQGVSRCGRLSLIPPRHGKSSQSPTHRFSLVSEGRAKSLPSSSQFARNFFQNRLQRPGSRA